MTSPIIDFIEARLAEDQKTAEAAAELCGCHPAAPVWTHIDDPNDGDRIVIEDDPHGHQVKRKLARKWCRTYADMFHGKHIARHDPARVLREVAAKREMLSRAARSLADADKLEGMGVQPADVFTIRAPAEYTLSLLAAPYSDHPDFDPNWSTT